MRFKDLRSAGRHLAVEVERFRNENTVVLAVARGGVPVAAEVAARLRAPMDITLVRRLLVPQEPDEPIFAVNVAGNLVVDEALSAHKASLEPSFEFFLTDALNELAQRERACRRNQPPLQLAKEIVIVVDNGIRTGLTMRGVIRALRTRGPCRIVVAVPVTSNDGRMAVEAVSDEIVFLATPEPFGHVGIWYEKYSRPSDEEIAAILDEVNGRP